MESIHSIILIQLYRFKKLNNNKRRQTELIQKVRQSERKKREDTRILVNSLKVVTRQSIRNYKMQLPIILKFDSIGICEHINDTVHYSSYKSTNDYLVQSTHA